MVFDEWFTKEQFDRFLVEMLVADYVAIDTETNGYDIRSGEGYCMGVSIAFDSRSHYFPWRHSCGYNYPKEWLDNFHYGITNIKRGIFHNAKFDLVSLSTIGIDYKSPFYDTMLMAHAVNENFTSKALDWLGKTLLHEGKAKSREFINWVKAAGWGNVPSGLMFEYAEQDAVLTLKLFNYLYPDFDSQDQDGELWQHKQDFSRLLAIMECRGVGLDTGLCKERANYGRARMEFIAKELGFNPGSPKQLGEFLLGELCLPEFEGKTPIGGSTFNKAAMEHYDALLETLDSPVARKVVEYRGWSKALAVAYEGYPALLSYDGRLRPNYKMHGTVTGRLSCEKPNLQQIPRVSIKEWDGALKSVFIPKPGYELWEADYSQLEFRLGAAYAGERGLLKEFAKPDSDVFTRMAGDLGFTRQDTKTLTYTLQYGGGIKRLCDVFRVESSRASEIRDTYFRTYPGFKVVTDKSARLAKRRGYVKTWSGRRRHFENPEQEAHKAFNSVIQGGAADIVERTMLRLYKTVDGPDCRMLLQVHDSVVFEIRSETVDAYIPKIKSCMEAVEPDFGVYFAAQVKRWGE